MLYGLTSAANRGGPLVQEYFVALDASEIATDIVAPTPAQLLTEFDQYIINIENQVAPYSAGFVASGNDFTNTNNPSWDNILLAPAGYPAVYQSMRLSSTDTDDDNLGWVIGSKVENGRRHFVSILLQLSTNTDGFPAWFLRFSDIPDTVAPSSTVPYFPANTFNTQVHSFGAYPASNASGRDGWRQPPWNNGIYVKSSFNGYALNIVIFTPGAASTSGSVLFNETFTTDDLPELAGFIPNAGLFNRSQVGGRWSNYTLSNAGREALNLDTQTLWVPDDGTLPITYSDTGIPISDLIIPGRYARSTLNDRWMKVDPYTKVAALSDPAPF